jgi:DNA-binding response OmpR family regulator/DNA-binding CsgD family transcriptional regulator
MSQRSCILVVDDAPETLGLLDTVLEDAGYVVLMAQSAHAAFTVLERNRPDIILIDAVMPGMGGLEACMHMKADATLAAIPVVFMTGMSETEHVVRAFEAGAADYVTKPLQLDEVLARLNVHLLAARRAQAAHRALDGAGRFLFAVDPTGRLLWATPQAASLLARDEAPVPETLARQLAAGSMIPGSVLPGLSPASGGSLRISFVGVPAPGELLLRVAPDTVRPEMILKERLDLTLREAEVLMWISYGKATRDIADILSLSPRTVDKHLEQIYNKLGIANRASAASLAARTIGEFES